MVSFPTPLEPSSGYSVRCLGTPHFGQFPISVALEPSSSESVPPLGSPHIGEFCTPSVTLETSSGYIVHPLGNTHIGQFFILVVLETSSGDSV